MARSCSYDWAGICIGDLHNKGYFNEACFKEHGKSGLHYIIHDVLKQTKLTTEVFKTRKFQENFLLQTREANRDVCFGYCMAACMEFHRSTFFPTNADFAQSMRTSCNHSGVLLSRFKEWVKKSSDEDVTFKHHASAFNYYGPLMQLYDDCIRYNDGKAREVVFKPTKGWLVLYDKGVLCQSKKERSQNNASREKGILQDKISSKVIFSYEKGVEKIKKDLKVKLYECFPDLRYNILVEESGTSE
ncbi:Hypothetical predicted protein [Paramuricea clavata]|uniref:Uncharacterized protein n=1 Tax=Paramuricea clavata TaxID=317549 RepID=A0A7D9JU27_PARCT|nr:Hypothetical predicted protein [Paramuricea clavata]